MNEHEQGTGLSDFVAELRRRHVVRFAFAYGAGAFVVLQLAEIVFPAFGIGESGLRLLVIATTLAFPPSLVLAWVYDVSREGITRTDGAPSGPLRRAALGTLLLATIGATGGLGLWLTRQGVLQVPEVGAVRSGVTAASYDPADPIRSIAVLPLADYSPDSDQAYFTSSMHEELIAKLSKLDGLRVVSRTTVMRYAQSTLTAPEIGRELDVDVIVEGSITRSGDRTRVTLQIIHAPSDSHIETLQWDEERVDDVLAFQTEIARQVVATVAGDADPAVFTEAALDVDPAAQEAFFRGRYAYEQGTPDGYRTAMRYFEEAVEQDPDFAPALAGLAGARFLVELDEVDVSGAEMQRAHEEAAAALEIDSSSIEAREVLALIERSMPRVMPAQPAIPAPELPPTETLASGRRTTAMVLPDGSDTLRIDVGGFDTACVASFTTLGERIEERVRRWSDAGAGAGPSGPDRETGYALRYLGGGRFADAARILEEVVDETPEHDRAWSALVHARVSQGNVRGAVDAVERWHEAGGPEAPDATSVEALTAAVRQEGRAGYWSWRLERLESLRAADRPVSAMDLATAHAALGNDREAVELLVEATEGGDPAVVRIRTDPAWDDLRTDPRVRAIAREADRLRTRRPGGGVR